MLFSWIKWLELIRLYSEMRRKVSPPPKKNSLGSVDCQIAFPPILRFFGDSSHHSLKLYIYICAWRKKVKGLIDRASRVAAFQLRATMSQQLSEERLSWRQLAYDALQGRWEEDRYVTDSCFFLDWDGTHDPSAACLIKLFSVKRIKTPRRWRSILFQIYS